MRNTRIGASLTVLVLLAVSAAPQLVAQQRDAEVLLQQAMHAEQVEGDLEQAIRLYRGLVEEHGAVRPVAASALLHLGLCYEKLGREDATNAYERLLAEYGDQSEIATEARARLAALLRAEQADEATSITTRRVSAGMNVGAHDPTPDGNYLVWGDYQGTMNLAVREVATGESRYLTQDARHTPRWATAYGGRVSPDGKRVAYALSEQGQGGSLRVVGMDGENHRELLREQGCWVQPYEWTSDAEHIAARWDCWPESNPEGIYKIVLVSVADGSVRVVNELPTLRYGFRSWLSPDDRYLVYGGPVEEDDGNADIWVLPLDGSDELPLIQHPADDQLLGWLPGTSYVLFLSDRDGTWDLWAASVSDGTMVAPPRKVRRDMGGVTTVGFSADGSFFYSVFTRWFTTSIAPVDEANGAANLEAAIPLLGSIRGPTWSPDGEHLAFVAEPQHPVSKRGRLHIRNLSTGEERELAAHLSVRRTAGWSRDGLRVAVVALDETRDDPEYEGGLYAVDVVNGAATLIMDNRDASVWPDGLQAVWPEDGNSIIYLAYDDDARDGRIVARELLSGSERELYRDSLLTEVIDLTPDGRRLVLGLRKRAPLETEGDAVSTDLVALDLEEGSTRVLATVDRPARVTGTQWSPNGQYVMYAQRLGEDESRRTEVLRVGASGGEPEHLWTTGRGKYGSWFQLSPDGRQIALTTYTQETEIWVMENLKEVLGRER